MGLNRNILPTARELFINGNIYFQTYSVNMKIKFIHKILLFISKWGIEVVPIDICTAITDAKKNTTNYLNIWPEMKTRRVQNCNQNHMIDK